MADNEIRLRGYQVPCAQETLNNWYKGFPSIITADQGAGKTIISTICANLYKADKVFVLGPKSSLTKWERYLHAFFDKEDVYCSTYEGWRGCGTIECPSKKQPYTYKRKVKRSNKEEGYDFYPTKEWVDLVKEKRVVFILDEFHKVKNVSQRTMASAANTRTICLGNNESRVLCLSATPCDRRTSVPIHMYLLGLIKSDKLVSYDRRLGIYDVFNLMKLVDIAEKFGEKVPIKKINEIRKVKYMKGRGVYIKAADIAADLFLDYIRIHIVFTCEPDFKKDKELIPVYYNYLCLVSDKTGSVIKSIITGGGDDEKVIAHIHHSDEYKANEVSMAILNVIQQNIERIKTPIYIELAKEFLIKNKKGKVVIMVNYLETLDTVSNALNEYNPVKIEGKMSRLARDESIDAFQAHNLDSRLLIATLRTGGESIDLHDTSEHGEYPRLLLIPPCFYTIDMAQAAGRVFRDSVTSKSNIYIVYAATKKDGNLEMRFYNGIRTKTNTIKDYHAVGQKSTLPCDYLEYITTKLYKTTIQ